MTQLTPWERAILAGFSCAGKRNPRAGLHGGIEGRSRAIGACLPDKHSQEDCPERQIAMTCAANQSYCATTARVVHIKRRISSLEFESLSEIIPPGFRLSTPKARKNLMIGILRKLPFGRGL